MSEPLSPPPVTDFEPRELPAYVSNGCIGLRVLDLPLLPGICMVSGFAGIHPSAGVEGGAEAPYPLAGDIGVDGAWLTTSPDLAEFVEQVHDFSTGELTTRFRFRAGEITVDAEAITFCSRAEPTLALQETTVTVSDECQLSLRATIGVASPVGRLASRTAAPFPSPHASADGSILWASLGDRGSCGLAMWSEVLGAADPGRRPTDAGDDTPPATTYQFRAHPGQRYQFRQVTAVIPSVSHPDPDREAIRQVSRAASLGFDALREANRAEWRRLWLARVRIDADDDRWQRLADAAFYYLNASVHRSAPASTSIFGLAAWRNYHYYYGHVMWDIETFAMPPLLASQPSAARALLDFRTRTLEGAHRLARLRGRAGLAFPWESAPGSGDEASPGVGTASWDEDHISPGVAHAFAVYAHATGDDAFLRRAAAPVLYGVADWLETRVEPSGDGVAFRRTMGPAERREPADDDAYTVMLSGVVLDEAIRTAERLGDPVGRGWRRIREGLSLPVSGDTGAIESYRGWRPADEKGTTPGPAAGIWPVGAKVGSEREQATLRRYLGMADGYLGSPMFSALYGTWAAWTGDRALALDLLDRGYAQFATGRHLQTLEYRPDAFPDEPRAAPFFANLGGFLLSLYYGLPGIEIGPEAPPEWARRPVILPEGWRSIEVDRAWFRNTPTRIRADHGADRAQLDVDDTGATEALEG
jgi:hypothetical protein